MCGCMPSKLEKTLIICASHGGNFVPRSRGMATASSKFCANLFFDMDCSWKGMKHKEITSNNNPHTEHSRHPLLPTCINLLPAQLFPYSSHLPGNPFGLNGTSFCVEKFHFWRNTTPSSYTISHFALYLSILLLVSIILQLWPAFPSHLSRFSPFSLINLSLSVIPWSWSCIQDFLTFVTNQYSYNTADHAFRSTLIFFPALGIWIEQQVCHLLPAPLMAKSYRPVSSTRCTIGCCCNRLRCYISANNAPCDRFLCISSELPSSKAPASLRRWYTEKVELVLSRYQAAFRRLSSETIEHGWVREDAEKRVSRD